MVSLQLSLQSLSFQLPIILLPLINSPALSFESGWQRESAEDNYFETTGTQFLLSLWCVLASSACILLSSLRCYFKRGTSKRKRANNKYRRLCGHWVCDQSAQLCHSPWSIQAANKIPETGWLTNSRSVGRPHGSWKLPTLKARYCLLVHRKSLRLGRG